MTPADDILAVLCVLQPVHGYAWWRALRWRGNAVEEMHRTFDGLLQRTAGELSAQRQHAAMLWPQNTGQYVVGGQRRLSQVEEIISEIGDVMLHASHLDPAWQQQQMRDDTQALLDSYKPPGGDDGSQPPA